MDHKIDIQDLIGKPFVSGGRGPQGYDCWGLVMEVFRRYGITLRDYRIDASDTASITAAADMDVLNGGDAGSWKNVTSYNEPEPPRLVTFQIKEPGKVNHVGAYIGEGRVIHVLERKLVCIERIRKYQNFIEGIYEFKK